MPRKAVTRAIRRGSRRASVATGRARRSATGTTRRSTRRASRKGNLTAERLRRVYDKKVMQKVYRLQRKVENMRVKAAYVKGFVFNKAGPTHKVKATRVKPKAAPVNRRVTGTTRRKAVPRYGSQKTKRKAKWMRR